jgi:hypothetical protein
MYSIDVANCSVKKYGEELCGDNVEIVDTEDGVIVVLSDGLGSGVKANILATLTSKIAITMLKEGASIEDTIVTIINTLPECQVRKMAYSTFTILKINQQGEVYMVEYDNPPVFFYRHHKPFYIHKEQREVNGKLIYESNFQMREGDTLTIVSDGAIHAGVGQTLNLGWQWEHIDSYLQDLVAVERKSEGVAKNLLGVCNNLYANKPGDDTTVVTVKLQPIVYLDLFTGPPKDKEDDQKMLDHLQNAKGKTVLCGGTTANIVSKAWNAPIEIDLTNYTKKVPPMGYMKGVDLVTEGLLTLNATKELLEGYLARRQHHEEVIKITGEHGAAKLARLLVDDTTHINFWIGQAINPAHQNPDFPENFNIKNKIINEIACLLRALGKKVNIYYL